ncbi:hypothetical protein [uncultured Thiodictyon sp.]|uniref:hypothetical protein n=1 Tax=uncultured Thiodictyon sp. TaxID=1846217 RepID=UPI0026001716|nr:hypothetical protein [uncultured Thiodictyon sp.]
MALDQKALQKKRAKRELKRKQAKTTVARQSGGRSLPHGWASAAQAPIADVFAPTDLSAVGMGTVWFNRRLPDGRYAIAGFVVDTYCLGVKNALYNVVDEAEYASLLAHIRSGATEVLERQDPAYARKLVEGAVDYAKALGFEPHEDYRNARALFGDIDAASCPVQFTFGRDGKPLYIQGPDDSPAMMRRIAMRLSRHA